MKTYTIPQGMHRSVWFPRFHAKGYTFNIKVQFNSSCRYRVATEDQNDINKIGGYSFGFDHHKNSFRLGWRWNLKTKKIEIFSYCYNNYDCEYEKIHECSDTSRLDFDIRRIWFAEGYKWVIHIDDNGINSMKYVDAPDRIPDYGYKLFPYFGGNQAAPHDIEIKVEL